MNYKEFFGRFQHSAEGRYQMGEQQAINLQEKYRMSGASQYGYSFEQFQAIRKEQMTKLYDAYVGLNHGNHYGLMGPRDSMDTSENALRSVTGPNMTYNNGFIAVDSIDRNIISSISRESYKVEVYDRAVNGYELPYIVDSTEALYGIASRASGQMIPLDKMLTETDVLKTEMAKTSQVYNNKTYGEYAQYHPQPKGFLSKVFKAVSKLVEPEKYAEKQNRFEEQEVPGIE